jgi:hypothetical protein
MGKNEENLPDKQVNRAASPKLYKLTGVIEYRGVLKAIGDEVELDDQQAEQLRKTGHIA